MFQIFQFAIYNFSCFEANLNGEYFEDPEDNGFFRGMFEELEIEIIT